MGRRGDDEEVALIGVCAGSPELIYSDLIYNKEEEVQNESFWELGLNKIRF